MGKETLCFFGWDLICIAYKFFPILNVILQAKVFSRFESLQKALKNYTLEGTPDDKSGVLQQVWFSSGVLKRIYLNSYLDPWICYTVLMYVVLICFYQGGMFVFKGKQLLYAWKDEGTGDHAPLDDIFDACCRVPVAWSLTAYRPLGCLIRWSEILPWCYSKYSMSFCLV